MTNYYGKREVWEVTEWGKRGSVKKTRNTGRVILVLTTLPIELESAVANEAGGDLLVNLSKPEWPTAIKSDRLWIPLP